MPNPVSPEASAIEDAYQDQVQALFKVLFGNLVDEPVTHLNDQQCVEKFAASLSVAKRARDLALKAVGA